MRLPWEGKFFVLPHSPCPGSNAICSNKEISGCYPSLSPSVVKIVTVLFKCWHHCEWQHEVRSLLRRAYSLKFRAQETANGDGGQIMGERTCIQFSGRSSLVLSSDLRINLCLCSPYRLGIMANFRLRVI